MIFEAKRTVKKEVEETFNVELRKIYTIRVIQDGSVKKSIYEESYAYRPNEEEICDILFNFLDKKCFAVLEEHYTLTEVKEETNGNGRD